MTGAPRRIVVVGGGAAGVLAAVALLDRHPGPAVVTVVEPADLFGDGVAYATRDPLHRLNVPAGKLAATLADPGDFVTWSRRRDPDVGAADFLPRGEYGAYLRDALARAAAGAATRGVELRRHAATVVGLRPGSTSSELLDLDDGAVLEADEVVLALGIGPATRPAVLDGATCTFSSPWAPGALDPLPPGSTCLLVGTGLTAVDAALSLADASEDVHVVATSRTGLVPFAHLASRAGHAPVDPPVWPDEPLDLDTLCSRLHAHIAEVESAGGDWRDAMDSLRPRTTALWQRLPLEERQRFLREAVRWWDVRRHRMAPDVGARVEELRANGRLRILAGRIAAVRVAGDGVDVSIVDAGGASEPVHAARIVSCTGFAPDIATTEEPLLRALLDDGRAAPDELGIGLRTTPDAALVAADGVPSPRIHVLGALRRGELWESTAVPELRAQAAAIAETVAGR